MTQADLDNSRTEMLRALYKTSLPAAKVLDNLANRKRDRRIIEVDRLEEILPDVERSDIIEVFKKLDEFGFGQFLVGRRGAVSRFEWNVSLRSVGRAALGKGTVEAVSEDSDEENDLSRTIRHEYRLRPDFTAQIELPENLTSREATRLADFLKTLPFID